VDPFLLLLISHILEYGVLTSNRLAVLKGNSGAFGKPGCNKPGCLRKVCKVRNTETKWEND